MRHENSSGRMRIRLGLTLDHGLHRHGRGKQGLKHLLIESKQEIRPPEKTSKHPLTLRAQNQPQSKKPYAQTGIHDVDLIQTLNDD